MNLEKVVDLAFWLDEHTDHHTYEEWVRLLGELLLEHLNEHEYNLKTSVEEVER